MRLHNVLVGAGLVAATALITANVVSQDRPTTQARGEADGDSKIETWVRYAMPTEEHALLEKLAGRWDLRVRYRMDAESEVVESAGTAERKWILGRRFLLEEFDGGSLALPFQAVAIYGYDAFERKYTSVWVDSLSTGVTTSLGTCADEGCGQITFVGRRGDPWTGVKRHTRGVSRFVSDDEHVLELYEPDSDGTEFRVLEIVYTRAKPPKRPQGTS